MDIPLGSAVSSPVRRGLRPTQVGGPSSTKTIPGRSGSAGLVLRELGVGKATRRSNSSRASFSGVSARGSRVFQNSVMNSERATGSERRE
jgi:hypothetical protein